MWCQKYLINMILDKTIRELTRDLDEKKLSVKDIVEECYANIEKFDGQINSFIFVRPKEEVLKEAEILDGEIASGRKRGVLHGIPFVLKDSYVTQDIQTTAASNILKGYKPQYSATVYKKLLESGALLIGKTNMDAWGHGASSENSDFGPVHNPWDTSRVAGGSSGGAGAAVACRFCSFAIGEDTGGSIRNPAAWCNITGLKVTYGRVSRYGCISYASSFDTVGPMAKTVEDCAFILGTIAGHDSYDGTSAKEPVLDYAGELDRDFEGIKIGIPEGILTSTGLDPEIKVAINNACKTLRNELKIQLIEVPFSLLDYAIPTYYIIAPSETSSNLARYDGIRYGSTRDNFTPETKRRIMIGTYALSAGYYDAYYKKAELVRTLFIKDYENALSNCNAILMPVNPTPPTKLGELINDPVASYLSDIFTVSQNIAGLPSLAVPCGFTQSSGIKLPIGMQFVGKAFSEELLLKLGHKFQQVTEWHKERPKL